MRTWLLSLTLIVLGNFPVFSQKYQEMIDAGTFTLQEIQQEAEAYFKVVGHDRGSGYKPFKRWEYVAQLELDEQGKKIPNLELSQAARNYRRAEKQRQEAESSLNFAGNWKQLGPTSWNATSSWSPGLGRVTSIGIDEGNTNHLIVGSPTGGVWKTLNGGSTWTPISDEFSTIDVYALEISPYNNQQYLWGSTSGKIFRSTDAGATWNTTGNVSGNGKVIRILYHPTDPNVVYAVSESNGLFRSTNSGANWTAVSGVSGIPGYDVEFKADDPNTLYFSGINVYRSTNGGNSFSQVNGFGTANNNYKMIGVSPAKPNTIYVLEANGGRFGAFYKSTDAGASFIKTVDGANINYFGYSATGDDDKGQAPRDMDIAVNPYNGNEVHISGVHTWKSNDGGVSFQLTSYWIPGTAASLGVGYNHADVGILKFAGNTLYVGSDGGFFISTDGAASFQSRSVGLAIREFYKIGVSKTNPNVVTGGSQDNGTSVMRTNNRLWVEWIGADGMETFVDWNNSSILYGTSQYGSMYRSVNQGNTQSGIDKPVDADGAWVTPFEQDPQVSTTIYVAFADVWKSTNSGGTWTKISSFDNGNMNQMKLAPSDNKRIYVSRGSSLFTTADGGSNWTTTAVAWGTNSISYLSVHPNDPKRLLVVTSSAVYHSIDAGATWTNIGAGLPSGAKYCATWEKTGKNGIYVGGFGFVSYTNDDLNGQWIGFFDGLPNARVYELEINYISNTIFAGTYGRGLWESPLYHLLPPVAAVDAIGREGCEALDVAFRDRSENSPKTWNWSFEGGNPAASTEQNPVVHYSGAGSYDVHLITTNDAGADTLYLPNYITVLAPEAPQVANTERCAAGELSWVGSAPAGRQIFWYAGANDLTPLFTGDTFTTSLTQTTTFYASTGAPYTSTQFLGPANNEIGTGGDHGGGQFLILNVQKPVRLSSALVYAAGAANRTFQLKNAAGTVLLEKTIFIEDGPQRVTLDLDIPPGANLQLGCVSPANLYRNNAGASYPYSINGLLQITGSTGGSPYYYYLYDIAVESEAICESERIAVQGSVYQPLSAPELKTIGSTVLCPGDSVQLTVDPLCPDCIVSWSNGAQGQTITVFDAGLYTATVRDSIHSICGESPVSNAVTVSTLQAPDWAPQIIASGPGPLCPGDHLAISVQNECPSCLLTWSNGANSPEIIVDSAGIFTAAFSNTCGTGPSSDPLEVSSASFPEMPSILPSGPTTLCPGDSVLLSAVPVCAGCSISWSDGSSGPSILATIGGMFIATAQNVCGSIHSEPIELSVLSLPETPVLGAAGSTILCAGDSVLLSAAPVCAGCTISWSDGSTGPSLLAAAGGTYTATAQNACGSSASEALELGVLPLPEPPVLSPAGIIILCPGESVQLLAQTTCADCNVLWSNGSMEAEIFVSSMGTFTAIATNTCGNSAESYAIDVFTESLPPAPVLAPAGPLSICPGETLFISVINDICFTCTVQWSNGQTGLSITVDTAGVYTARIDQGGFCGPGPVSNAVEVNAINPAVPIVTVDSLCLLAAPAGTDYQWLLNGVAIPGAQSQFWEAQEMGQYVVHMTNLEGCAVQSEPVFAEACLSGTLQPEEAAYIRLYPNPARDRIFMDIQVPEAGTAQLDLFTSDGRLAGTLFKGNLTAGKQKVEIILPELPSGIYPYRLTAEKVQWNGALAIQPR